MQSDGHAGVYDGDRWWTFAVDAPEEVHEDPTVLRRDWLAQLGTDRPLRFSGPGVDAPVP